MEFITRYFGQPLGVSGSCRLLQRQRENVGRGQLPQHRGHEGLRDSVLKTAGTAIPTVFRYIANFGARGNTLSQSTQTTCRLELPSHVLLPWVNQCGRLTRAPLSGLLSLSPDKNMMCDERKQSDGFSLWAPFFDANSRPLTTMVNLNIA